MNTVTKKNKPMASAPFVFNGDGSVAWEKMWDSFCDLAIEGGPPHRGTPLTHTSSAKTNKYNQVVAEILRAYKLLIPYPAIEKNGWIEIKLLTPFMARWYQKIIEKEHVECRRNGKTISLPVNETYTVIHEIKNVVTVVAKAYHYWKNHRNTAEKLYIAVLGVDIRWWAAGM